MHSAKGSQKIPRGRPQTFNGVDMHFVDSISIVITSPLVLTMTDGGVGTHQVVVTAPFIGVTMCRAARERVNVLVERTVVCAFRYP